MIKIIILKIKTLMKKKKRKYEETKNTMEDSDVFNVDFNE